MPEGPEIRRAADNLGGSQRQTPDGCLVCL